MEIKKAWHHDGIIWVRFPGIVHGLEIQEAKDLIFALNMAIEHNKLGINDDKTT